MESMEQRVRKLEQQRREDRQKIEQMSKKLDDNTKLTAKIAKDTSAMLTLMRIGKGGGKLLGWLAPIISAIVAAAAYVKFGKPM